RAWRRTRRSGSWSGSGDPCRSRSRSCVELLLVADEAGHAVDSAAPERLVLVQQPARDREPIDPGLDDLPTPGPRLGHEAGALEDRDVLLHGSEAHRVVRRELGDALLAGHRATEDVAPGGVREGAEDPVDGGWLEWHHLH